MKKLNIGVDYSLFEGMLAGSLEFFRDERSNIFVFRLAILDLFACLCVVSGV